MTVTEKQKQDVLKLEEETRHLDKNAVIQVPGPQGPQDLLVSYLRYLAEAIRSGAVK